jgi:hypothetical protein
MTWPRKVIGSRLKGRSDRQPPALGLALRQLYRGSKNLFLSSKQKLAVRENLGRE